MKNIISAACIAIAASVVPVSTYAADSSKETAKEFVKDSVITAKIKADFAKDRTVSAMRISVDTDKNGVVRLSGTARSQAEIDQAITLAKSVKGVTSVNNEISLQPKT